MIAKDERRLKVGVLGCGPIAQAAHLEACVKARNADLYAICDVAEDLLERMACAHGAERTFTDYDAMLADPGVEAVIVATSDAFHVEASVKALRAGKHVLCEKPLGVSVEEVEGLRDVVRESGRLLQVGHMKRFDAGLAGGQALRRDEMGQSAGAQGLVLRLHPPLHHDRRGPARPRHQPPRPQAGGRPEGRPAALLHAGARQPPRRHRALALRPIIEVRARLLERFGAYCWFVEADFADGTLGHLDLTVAVRDGLARGVPALRRARQRRRARPTTPGTTAPATSTSSTRGRTSRRPLGADGHFYRRQLEGLRRRGAERRARCAGADVEDGLASVRAMVAIARSAEIGRARARRRRDGAGLMRLGIFAKTFPGTDPAPVLAAVRARRLRLHAVQHGLRRPARDARRDRPEAVDCDRGRGAVRGRGDRGALGHLQHGPPRPGRARPRACAGWAARSPRAPPGHAARHALHRHARSRGPVAPPPGQRHARGLARPACRDGEGAGAGGARTASTSASSPSSPTSSTSAGRRGPAARRAALARGSGSCSTPPTCSSRGAGGAPPDRRRGGRPARRRRRDGPRQGPRRRRRLRHGRGHGRRRLRPLPAPPARGGFDGPLVTHGLAAEEAPAVAAFLRGQLAGRRPVTCPATSSVDGLALRYRDDGGGLPPVVFQHGLGGSEAQAAETFPADAGVRRAHPRMPGARRLGPPAGPPLSIATFADDVAGAVATRRASTASSPAASRWARRSRCGSPRGIPTASAAWSWCGRPGSSTRPRPTCGPTREVARPPARRHRRARPSPLRGAPRPCSRLAREAPDNLASLLASSTAGRARPSPSCCADRERRAGRRAATRRRRSASPRWSSATASTTSTRSATARELAATIPSARLARGHAQGRRQGRATSPRSGPPSAAFLRALPEDRTPP